VLVSKSEVADTATTTATAAAATAAAATAAADSGGGGRGIIYIQCVLCGAGECESREPGAEGREQRSLRGALMEFETKGWGNGRGKERTLNVFPSHYRTSVEREEELSDNNTG
jgi:hypothetical protein